MKIFKEKTDSKICCGSVFFILYALFFAAYVAGRIMNIVGTDKIINSFPRFVSAIQNSADEGHSFLLNNVVRSADESFMNLNLTKTSVTRKIIDGLDPEDIS